MNFRDKSATAWSNLGRRKVRTALTSIGVIVGITTVVTMISLVNGVQLQVKKQFEQLGLDRVVVRPAGEGNDFNPFNTGERTKNITPADVERWRSWPAVRKVVAEIELPWSVVTKLRWRGKSKTVRVSDGTSLRRGPFSPPPTILAGTLDVPQQRGAIVLSKAVIKQFGVSPPEATSIIGQKVEVRLEAPRGEKQTYAFKIIGVSSATAAIVQIPMLDRLAMKGWWNNEPDVLKSDGYDSVTLRAADVGGAKEIVTQLRREKWAVQSIDALLDVANRIFSVITALLALVSSVALLVACIGIVNTMIMSIYERTREIGTLKAMGASRSDIRQMFMIEAGLIGLLGGIAGLIGSWLLGRLLNRIALWYAQGRDVPLPENLFIITPSLALAALFFAALIGVLAGLYPANRAARLDPLMALRHE